MTGDLFQPEKPQESSGRATSANDNPEGPHWWLTRPVDQSEGHRDLQTLNVSLNLKYGRYDYTQDVRSIDNGREFEQAFQLALFHATSMLGEDVSNLVVGSNSGYEIPFLRDMSPTTAVDLSDVALGKLKTEYPHVDVRVADALELPFSDEEFPLSIACRVLHASNLDFVSAVSELLRVTERATILSISNGYLVDGEVIQGMYDYDSGTFRKDLPEAFRTAALQTMDSNGWDLRQELRTKSEIFIVAAKR